MSAIRTRTPSFASATAIDWPIPDAAPVTSAPMPASAGSSIVFEAAEAAYAHSEAALAPAEGRTAGLWFRETAARVGPECCPGSRVAKRSLRGAAAAGDERGEERPAGRLAGRLVSQIQADPDVVAGNVLARGVHRALIHQQYRAWLHFECYRLAGRLNEGIGDRVTLGLGTVCEQRHPRCARNNLKAPVLAGGRRAGDPDGQHVARIGFLEEYPVVLMPRHGCGEPVAAGGCGIRGQLQAQVLGRIAGDLGSGNAGHQVEQVLVDEDREDAGGRVDRRLRPDVARRREACVQRPARTPPPP